MKKTSLSNETFNSLIRATSNIISLVTLMYVARVLQPEMFGRTCFAASFVLCFMMFSNLVKSIFAIRTCTEKKENRAKHSHFFNECWTINVLTSVASICLLFILVLGVSKLRANGLLLAVYGMGVFSQMIECEWLFNGFEKFRFLAFSDLAIKVVSLVGIIVFVHSPKQIGLCAAFTVLMIFGGRVLVFVFSHGHDDTPLQIQTNKSYFRPLLGFFMTPCSLFIYSCLDLTALGFMRTDYETGIYGVAAYGKTILALFGCIVWTAIMPTVTKFWKDDERKELESLVQKTIVVVIGIQFFVTVICFTLARELILLVGGEQYLDAVVAFRILLLSMVPVGVSNILGGLMLIAGGKEQKLVLIEIVGAVIDFATNLVLIPMFSVKGAATATVLAGVVVWLMCSYCVKKDLQIKLGGEIYRKVLRRLSEAVGRPWARFENWRTGDKLPFYCPCCQTHLRSFVDRGYDKMPYEFNSARYRGMDQKVICPVCRALPRHRILALYFEKHKDWLQNKKILIFALEKSVHIWFERNQIGFTSADLYKDADLRIDIEDTKLADNSYDLIICNHVLEHVTDYKKALSEMRRILNPNGRIIISFPTDRSLEHVYEDASITTKKERIEKFGQADHLRVFGRDSEVMLEKAGFIVTAIEGNLCDKRIKPIIGPADYDYNVLWCLEKRI